MMKRTPRKSMKTNSGGKASLQPQVVLKPLKSDDTGHSRYRFSSPPPTAALFNDAEFSDVKLKVCDTEYHAHKLILSAGSEVFRRMLSGNWKEAHVQELVLEENEDCAQVFERFLHYFYTGTIIISDSYVWALFLLADKYDVRPVYHECVKVLIDGLEVYVADSSFPPYKNPTHKPSTSLAAAQDTSDSSMSSDTSEDDVVPIRHMSHSHPPLKSGRAAIQQLLSSRENKHKGTTQDCKNTFMGIAGLAGYRRPRPILAASEVFPLTQVLETLQICTNEDVTAAALYNVEARLAKQLLNGNLSIWNQLGLDLVIRLLSDTHFNCVEHVLFSAALGWLMADPTRLQEDTPSRVLSCIRYPLLTSEELYAVENHPAIKDCTDISPLVRQAVWYKLFNNEKTETPEGASWCGTQFVERCIKPKKQLDNIG